MVKIANAKRLTEPLHTVFSADMFTVFENKLLSPEVGMRYRKEILEVGGTRDAMESLKAFLGREPRQEPFLASKGLSAAAV